MENYVIFFEETNENMAGMSNTPVSDHLFDVNGNLQIFWEKTKQYFITMTNMFLFLSKRARPDLQEAVAFLTTVVNVPTMYDYKNFSGSSDIWEGNTKHP